MSLSNIKLPGFVIADLYRTTLIQPTAADGFVPLQNYQEPAEPEPVKVAAQPVAKTAQPEPVIEKAPPKPVDTTPYRILGNNKKQITVVVNCPQDVFVPEGDLQFLTKMLDACKLNMADVAIVNHATAAVNIEKVKAQLQPKFLLLFGVEPDEIHLPINFPSYKEQPYAGTTYLFTPALSQLNGDTDVAKGLKKKLWECLKRMFL
ncbi:MAG TPA: hypothetical protein VIM79_20970 [Niastella sp.]